MGVMEGVTDTVVLVCHGSGAGLSSDLWWFVMQVVQEGVQEQEGVGVVDSKVVQSGEIV